MQGIEIKNVSFAYAAAPEKTILENINMKIEPGEFVCLIGQSGCGKSTLLRLLAGLEKPTDGEVLVDGKNINGSSLNLGVVFQDYGLFPWMTAGENIVLALKQKYPACNKKELTKIALDMLKTVGLDESTYSKLPKELSGGMKQRCAIAQTLSIGSPYLLMDEPFGALDAVTRAHLQDMLIQLRTATEPKKTFFFVTHDVDEALLLATHIYVLGQVPSNIIYQYSYPKGVRPTRANLYENTQLLSIRNTLIQHLNNDIEKHKMIDNGS